MSDTLFIVMPAYNEEGSLPRVLDQWYPIVRANEANRLVVINDGSTDGTSGVLEEYAQSHPQLVPISKKNGGHGAAIYYAYKLMTTPPQSDEKQPDFIFQTDSDGQTSPQDFEKLWALRHKYDAVFGHRNQREDGFSRVLVTNVLKLTVRALLKVSSPDANVPYRLMSRNALEKGLRFVPENFNLTNIALCASLHRQNMRVKYLPITFGKRTAGVNSINFKRIIPIGIKALGDFRAINSDIKSNLNHER